MRRLIPLALLVILAACGGDAPTEVPPPPPNADRDGDGILNVDDQCPDQPETVNGWLDDDGCPDATIELYVLAREVAEIYWQDGVFTDGSYRLISTFQDYTQPINFPCGTTVMQNALYCGVDEGVYYDITFFDTWLNDIGDMAPVFIIAHEIGHHVGITILQWVPGVAITPLGTVLTPKESELMADCFAGAFTGFANTAGLLESGDLDEAALALIRVGDVDIPWFDPTGHGTAGQRIDAFNLGVNGGPVACTDANFFAMFPEVKAEA